MKTMILLGTLVTMVMGAGCLASEEELETSSQPVAGGCTLLRPFGWNVAGVNCMESRSINTPYEMAAGESYFAIGVPWGVIGEGYAIVTCLGNGRLSVPEKECRRSSGSPL